MGRGILLVEPNGSHERRICGSVACGSPVRPRWSPDGRSIVFAGPEIRIVYPDGSCMDCQVGRGPNPAFKPGGGAISYVGGLQEVHEVGIDGIALPTFPAVPVSGASDAVWAANGYLAIVGDNHVWAGRPEGVREVARGTNPSWSPNGRELAVADRGWLEVVNVRTRVTRQLVRGSAPAFSPDGSSIAYVGPGRGLWIVPLNGRRRRPRRVGRVQVRSVDWQPLPRGFNPGCAAPPRSTVIASSAGAVVTADDPNGVHSPAAFMGCLRSSGRERLLERLPTAQFESPYDLIRVVGSALAAPYAALVTENEDTHYGDFSDTVDVFDLRTGDPSTLGGESAYCNPQGGPCLSIDDVVVASDGVSAVHASGSSTGIDPCTAQNGCEMEQIITGDRTGHHTVDSISAETASTPPTLSDLRLSGDQLTWYEAGEPRSVQLHP